MLFTTKITFSESLSFFTLKSFKTIKVFSEKKTQKFVYYPVVKHTRSNRIILLHYRLHLVAGRTQELFVRHVSLLRVIGEGGKLKLAADMAQVR